MKINWKVRFQNKAWLTAFISFVVATVYQFMSMFEIMPAIPQENVLNIVATVLQLLTLMGIIVDPTTQGMSDSARALNYTKPN